MSINENEVENIKEQISDGLVEKLVNEPSGHYVHILVARELQSSAIFTTNGQDVDITTVGISTDDGFVDYSPVMMFKRKQTGSDRRKGKEIQRNLIGIEDTMDVNEMTLDSPESTLYGSAAGNEAMSVTSRVMYDSAYSIRDSSAIVEEKFQNAPGDNFAKGATTAIREPDFIVPGTVFPCVITLRDATFDELMFVLGVTKMNKRYGAATSRIGRVQNHILGIYYGKEEGPANLILSKEVARLLARESEELNSENLNKIIYSPVIDVAKVKELVKQVFEEDIQALDIQSLDQNKVNDLLAYVTTDTLKAALERQKKTASEFFEAVNQEQ
ncbi:type I-D CRISPR-associated protein Cas7/Csc2 [Methanohalophilus sp. DAL1]|jgi:CRISPR-associated protein Csc2|uniref:type I-D CRISPR-associated protein Cas7/Csc2 n=1 Tax=Methanohalophilus sp. DAL1 TaxID=1864608 RepID=UPI000817E398|nr:type I-D CRISPR-associated protein Cas7/Csc2 [Methanohalophilus sp. DAL1]OBZ35416.1 MAG: type I-D CRISPR-associated protein Cas7/Csc2 [Methanohalophilus sp. DAL1]